MKATARNTSLHPCSVWTERVSHTHPCQELEKRSGCSGKGGTSCLFLHSSSELRNKGEHEKHEGRRAGGQEGRRAGGQGDRGTGRQGAEREEGRKAGGQEGRRVRLHADRGAGG